MSTNPQEKTAVVTTHLSAMMFLQFFVWGGWYVTVGNYLKGNGMESAIAGAYSLCPIAAIISPFFLGMIADRFFATQKVLGVMHLLGGAALLLLGAIATGKIPDLTSKLPTLVLPLLLVHALCYMPTLGLSNTLAFHHVKDPEKQFPYIRVFGTIGWIVANVIVSKIFHGDEKPIQFYVAGGAGVLLGLYCFALPHTPPPSAGKRAAFGDIMGVKSLSLMKDPSFATFVISSFLICIPLAFYYSFAPVFVGEQVKDTAASMSFGQVSEIFFMLVMPLFFARLGVKWMLLVGMLAWVVRYGFFALAATNHMMALVMGGILLHGICYDFFFVTGQIYVDKKAGADIRGQAQGFLVLITQGVGMLIGAQVAGKLVGMYTVDKVTNWHSLWILPTIAAGVIMVLFGVIFRENGAKQGASDNSPQAA